MLEKDNRFKLLKPFFNNPTGKFHIRELSRLTGLSLPAVSSILKKLESEKILKSERGKAVLNYYPDFDGGEFFPLKRFFNLYMLQRSGLVSEIVRKYNEPEAVVLFGSYSRGEDTIKSDVDLAIVTKRSIEFSAKKFEGILGRKINIHDVDLSKSNPEFLNDLANGVVLSGYLRALR
ncbi:MAG: nucleotidyltransferase domain-containing protein [archaeon]